MNTAINIRPHSRKPRSRFAHLPPADQKRIIDLCDQHTYNEVLEIIAKPRPEGLQLEASYGAIARFYTSYNQHARAAHLLGQSARTVQITRQAHPGALRGAILTLVESRIYEALRRDVPVTELSSEFAILKDFHKGFLSEEKWRTDKDSRADNEWSTHFTAVQHAVMDDFVPLDEHGNPTDFQPVTEAGRITAGNHPEARQDASSNARDAGKSTSIQSQLPPNPPLST